MQAEDVKKPSEGKSPQELAPHSPGDKQLELGNSNTSVENAKPKSVEPELADVEDSDFETETQDSVPQSTQKKADELDVSSAKQPAEAASEKATEEPAITRTAFTIDSTLLPFPERLMALLDGEMVKDSMWWLPDGDAFCLIPVVFAENVLDKYFQGTKFESFTRKLNRWGFKRVAGQKVPANTIAYYHKDFIRGQPKLLKNMNGGKTKFVSAREKRARAQIRRDREREKAILVATQQQQALYSDRLGLGGGVAGLAGAGGFLGAPGLDTTGNLSSLLASRQLALQQANDLRLAQQILASKQALAAEQQELQLRLLQGGGGGMQDRASLSSSLLAQNSFNPTGRPGGSLGGLSNLRRGYGDRAPADPMLSSGLPQSDLAGLMMAQQRLGATATSAGFAADGSSVAMKKLLKEEQLKKMAMAASSNSGTPVSSPAHKPADSGQLDPQLFHLYLQSKAGSS